MNKDEEQRRFFKRNLVANHQEADAPPLALSGFSEVKGSPKDKQINGDHYKNMAIQPSEFIYKNQLNWYEGNAVKYICRHKVKGGKTDIEKAIHYLELLLEEEYE